MLLFFFILVVTSGVANGPEPMQLKFEMSMFGIDFARIALVLHGSIASSNEKFACVSLNSEVCFLKIFEGH